MVKKKSTHFIWPLQKFKLMCSEVNPDHDKIM